VPLARLPVTTTRADRDGFLGLVLVFGLAGLHELANFAKLGAMAFFA
jgi:hypothetical protein